MSDPTQDDVDTYGRWLRYVQASGRDIGAAQIRSGSAEARDSSTPVSRRAKYAQMEAVLFHDDIFPVPGLRLELWSTGGLN